MRFLFPVLAAGSLALAACGGKSAEQAAVSDSLAVASAVVGDTLVVDTVSSEIGWTGRKVTGKHDGTFGSYNGYLIVDTTGVLAVNLTFDTRTITSDAPRLTEHLRSDEFFDVAKYPEATFVSTSITPLGDSTDAATGQHTQFTVTGNLTMHGVTKSVTFPASIRKSPSSVAARAEFAINRKDWGIVYTGKPDDLIRDEVDIRFNVIARPKGAEAPGAAIRAEDAFRDSVKADSAAQPQ
ncbi:MAG: YceI family protein [Rhodothermales bacterium]|nr:YceI family protein [Rhodothermales bacterium]